MPDSRPAGARRSGCAIVSGLFLIGLGLGLLGVNLYGLAFLRRASFVLDWLSLYWPLFLVIWGAFKIVQRLVTPERSRVSGLEVFGLVLLVLVGLMLSGIRRGLEELSHEGELEHLVEIVGPELLGAPHEFVETESFPLAPQDGHELVIVNQRGGVRVTGWSEERVEVRVRKRLHHHSEAGARSIADGVAIALARQEGGSSTETDAGSGAEGVRGPRDVLRVDAPEGVVIDTELVLRVPRTAVLEIRTRRGGIAVEEVEAELRLRTSDAPIEVTRVAGSLNARTNRGDIRLSSIGGNAEATTSRGAVHARDIGGDLDARTSRAPLVAAHVSGDARLENRYGSLRARAVSGNVTVTGFHTDVALEGLLSGARIEARQGTVFVRDAGDSVELQARRANVQMSAIRGSVVVDGSDSPATLSRIEGTLRFTARESDVRVADVRGAVFIDGAGDVELSGFGAEIEVTSRHGDIRVATNALAGSVTLDSRFGDLELTLPPEASANIEASTRNGTLVTNLESLELEAETRRPSPEADEDEDEGDVDGEERRWTGALGAGSHSVRLASEHGDVRVTVREP